MTQVYTRTLVKTYIGGIVRTFGFICLAAVFPSCKVTKSDTFQRPLIQNESTQVSSSEGESESEIDSKSVWKVSKKVFENVGGVTAVSFIDALHGWIGTDRGLYRTSDSGISWQVGILPAQQGDRIANISFTSDRRGLLVLQRRSQEPLGNRFRILQTSNGGETWSELHVENGGVASAISRYDSGWLVAGFKYEHVSPVCFNPLLLFVDAAEGRITREHLPLEGQPNMPNCSNDGVMGAAVTKNSSIKVITGNHSIFERKVRDGEWIRSGGLDQFDQGGIKQFNVLANDRIWIIKSQGGIEGTEGVLAVESENGTFRESDKPGYYFSDGANINRNEFVISGYKLGEKVDKTSGKLIRTKTGTILGTHDGGGSFFEICIDQKEEDFIRLYKLDEKGERLWVIGSSGGVIELSRVKGQQ